MIRRQLSQPNERKAFDERLSDDAESGRLHVYSVHCRVRPSVHPPVHLSTAAAADALRRHSAGPAAVSTVLPPVTVRTAAPPTVNGGVGFARLNDAEKWSSAERAGRVSRIAFRNQLFHIWSRRSERPFAISSPAIVRRGRSSPTSELRAPDIAAVQFGSSRRASISFCGDAVAGEFFFSTDEQTERGQCGDQWSPSAPTESKTRGNVSDRYRVSTAACRRAIGCPSDIRSGMSAPSMDRVVNVT